ncbi:unnamed protein product, partial [Bubo scandiacus]
RHSLLQVQPPALGMGSSTGCRSAFALPVTSMELPSSIETEWYHWSIGRETLNLVRNCYQCLTPSSQVLSQILTKSHSKSMRQESSDKGSNKY